MSLLETASSFTIRYLKEEHRQALRTGYFSMRTRLHPFLRAVYGTFDAAALREHLVQRIGNDFEILMVHSSVNHMKPMYTGTPLELVQMLVELCGPGRTLAMPAFYFGDPAIGGASATLMQRPRFDLRKTPSQMGLVTEIFRRSKGVVQSRHPVYRMSALGPLAQRLTEGHERAESPSGRGTPFEFMAKHDTRIIGIGKPIQVLTQAHHVEGVLGDEFPVPGHSGPPIGITIIDGKLELPVQLNQGRSLDWRFNIWKLQTIMDRNSLQEWNFHHVPMFATRARDVTESLINAARRGVTLYDKP